MKRLNLTATLVSTVVAAAALAEGSGDPVRGKELYVEQACYACHGYGGIGRRNIANKASGILINETVFLNYLRARGGQNPQFPAQTMPHYPASSLPDDDARDIYAYITTLVDNPPEIEDAPALKATLEAAQEKQ
jgi:cytochrome c